MMREQGDLAVLFGCLKKGKIEGREKELRLTLLGKIHCPGAGGHERSPSELGNRAIPWAESSASAKLMTR